MAKPAKKVVNVAEAKAHLSELVERASGGEEIVLARNGKPKAKLVPLSQGKKTYVAGSGKGKWKGMTRLLAEPMPDDFVAAFYESELLPTMKSK